MREPKVKCQVICCWRCLRHAGRTIKVWAKKARGKNIRKRFKQQIRQSVDS